MNVHTTSRTGTDLGWSALARGLFGGFLPGVGFIAINSWFATSMGKPALAPFKAVASLAQGPQAAAQGTATPTRALPQRRSRTGSRSGAA